MLKKQFLRKSVQNEIKLNEKLKNLNICIDGGINNEVLKKVDVQEAVSASYVLNSFWTES